eukprot:11035061-Karenia_brevis.AAC.1
MPGQKCLGGARKAAAPRRSPAQQHHHHHHHHHHLFLFLCVVNITAFNKRPKCRLSKPNLT